MMKRLIPLILLVLLGTLAILPAVEAQNTDWDLDDLVDLAALDINDFWEGVFDEVDLRYTEPDIEISSREEIRSDCGRVAAGVGPFYCSRDHTIYLPEAFMEFQLDRVGDFAVVVILAHEWGHAVQVQWFDPRTEFNILLELQADCFAGAYARHADEFSDNVRLDEGDLHEGILALYFAGDRNVEWYDRQAHGDSQQRLTVFLRGFQDGYEAC